MSHALQRLNRFALPMSVVAAAALLAACGGGGGDEDTTATNTPQGNTAVSRETAQSVSANSMVIGDDAAGASATVLSTTQVVVANGQTNQTYPCAGGGTAYFTASGASLAALDNHQLDTGESYRVQYSNCRSASGAASVNGLVTLDVVSATAGAVTVQTSTQGIVVTRPHRTLTLNGSSTLAQTVATSGASTTTTHHWTSPQITLTSQRSGGGSNSLMLSGANLTHGVTTTNGVVSGSTSAGTITISVAWFTHAWSATIATQGTASYDANGTPTQGSWTMTLPNNRIGLTVAAGSATVTLDHGPNGSIDATWVFPVVTLAGEAA